MAYGLESGSARNLVASESDFSASLRLDSAASPNWDAAHTLSAFQPALGVAGLHAPSPFDHASLQADQTVSAASHAPAAASLDSAFLARFEAAMANAPDDFVMRCMCPGCMKAAIAHFSPDDAQGSHGPHAIGIDTPHTAALDDIPDDNTSTVSLNVQEGQSITSVVQDQTDQDWFVVNLSDTNQYKFTLTPTDTNSSSGPDLIVSLYDEDGVLIQQQDGHGFGGGEELTFAPTEDGTYYVAVSSYASLPNAEYTIFGGIDNTPDPNAGTPLDAIDWGGTANRVDTDGVESPNGDDVIQFYFAKTGEVYESALAGFTVAQDWTAFEKAAAYTAFEQYDHIINTDYVEVGTAAEADFVLISHAFEPNILGVMAPPNEPHEGQAEFNNQGVGWTESGLEQGAFGFITLIHELGHGHGLAHPHDTGGGSTVMNGVVEEPPPSALDYTTGDFGLNNGVYTTMSYNDGWDKDGPNGSAPTNDYGYQGTMMAFDIAVLQQKYGANMTYHNHHDVYTLPDVNEAGTFYSCIWDAGGIDVIKAQGTLDSVIDLRAATLEYEVGGGGWVSHEEGIFGGLTIAHGVLIENAKGALGDDTITGNTAVNHLAGGSGRDIILGGGGNDFLTGERGIDHLTGGAGHDTFVFGTRGTASQHNDFIMDLNDLDDTINLSGIDAILATGADDAFVQVNHFHHTAGEMVLRYVASEDVTRVRLDTDGDGHSNVVIYIEGKHIDFDHFIM